MQNVQFQSLLITLWHSSWPNWWACITDFSLKIPSITKIFSQKFDIFDIIYAFIIMKIRLNNKLWIVSYINYKKMKKKKFIKLKILESTRLKEDCNRKWSKLTNFNKNKTKINIFISIYHINMAIQIKW